MLKRSVTVCAAPELPVYRIRTARNAVDQGLDYLSLTGSLLGAFATVGLLLAAIGIYGVVSYTVAQRTGELGIRMALGAQTRDVLWLVLRKGAIVVLTGAVIGLVGAYLVWRLLIAFIPLPTRDPLILALLVLPWLWRRWWRVTSPRAAPRELIH